MIHKILIYNIIYYKVYIMYTFVNLVITLNEYETC